MDRRLTPLVAILAGLSLLMFLGVIPWRLVYPFELEWQEGGMLAHLERLRAGAQLYDAPNLEFSAFPYPPVYHWVAAIVSSITGPGFLALRLVSVAASLATLCMLSVLLKRESGSALAALVGAGLFAAAFSWSGAWMDVGRVDSLALALSLGSLLLVRRGRGLRDALAAGVVAGLAVLTKQTALLPALALAVVLLGQDWRRWWGFAVGLFLLAGGGLAGLHVTSDGWSSWYLFELLGAHPWYTPKILGFWSEDMLQLAPLLIALAAGCLRGQGRRVAAVEWAWCSGLVLSAWMGRAHVGGYDNTLMPAALALALLGGHVVAWARASAVAGTPWMLAGVGLQFALLVDDPREHLPSAEMRAQGEAVVRALEQVGGPIFAPYQPHLAAWAGAGWSLHAMTLFDLSAADLGEVEQELFGQLRAALSEGRYRAVLLAEDEPFKTLLGPEYRLAPAGAFPAQVPVPLTGKPHAPRLLYLRQ